MQGERKKHHVFIWQMFICRYTDFFVCGSMCVASFQNLYYYNSYEQTKWVVNIIQTNKRKMTVAVDFMAVNRNQMNLLNKIKNIAIFFSLFK